MRHRDNLLNHYLYFKIIKKNSYIIVAERSKPSLRQNPLCNSIGKYFEFRDGQDSTIPRF